MLPSRPLILAASISGFLGVGCGAFGVHALNLVEPALGRWHTGSLYHLLHALAALIAAILGVPRAGWFFIAGTVVFSGSLYAMALTGETKLGAITPIGGLCFIIGWALLAYSGASRPAPTA